MKLKVTSIWFSEAVCPWRALWFTEYQRSKATGRRIGFIREVCHTMLVDLRRSEEEILAGFSAETRRLVRKAEKEGITYEVSTDMDEFVRFFNRFARQKKLAYWLNADTLKSRGKNYKITRAVKDGEVLFSHLYLCDEETRRAAILCGGSILKDGNRTFSNAVLSSANRGLHYFDMRMLKAGNYHVCDLGGYAPDTQDPELKRINDFKDEFRGTIVCEANYRSVLLHAASAMLNHVVAGERTSLVGKMKSYMKSLKSSLSRRLRLG